MIDERLLDASYIGRFTLGGNRTIGLCDSPDASYNVIARRTANGSKGANFFCRFLARAR
jgi:hypothetical protein